MAEETTGIKYSITVDDSQLKDAATRVQRDFESMSSSASKEGIKIDNTFKKLGAAIAGYFSIQAAANFARQIVAVRQEVQALEVSFSTLLGNEDKAAKLLSDIKDFAVKTPLQLNDLAKGAQMLLSFNVEAEKVMPILKSIGDISMGDAQKLQSLTLAFSQMSSTGKLMGQDLLQMINAGFNPLTIMAEQTGKSVAELKDEMSKGAISAKMVEDAFKAATSEGGKFYNMLNKQSKSIQGSFSNLQGAIYDMMNELGEKVQGPLSSTLDIVMRVVQNYDKIGRAAADAIAVFGAYKAAVMAITVAEKLRYQATLAQMAGLTKMQAITTVLKEKTAALNKTMLANPYVAVATAIAAMSIAVYRLSKNESKAEIAQKKFNKELERQKTAVDGAVAKYDYLITYLNAAKKGTDEYRVALKNITDEYGDYLDKLGIEAEMLKDVANSQVKLRSEIEKTSKLKAKSALLTGAEEQYNDMVSNARELIRNNLKKLYDEGSAEYVNAYNKILRLITKGEKLNTATFDYGSVFEGAKRDVWQKYAKEVDIIGAINTIKEAGEIYSRQIESILTVMDTAEEEVNDKMTQLKEALAAAENPEDKRRIQKQIEDLKKQSEPTPVKNKKYWEDQVKTLTEQMEALDLTVENEEKINELRKRVSKAQAYVDAYEPSPKGTNALENEAVRLKRQRELLTREEDEYEKKLDTENKQAAFQREQTRINMMDDGTEKRLRQIKLDYERERYAIEQEEERLINELADLEEKKWEAANPDKVAKGEIFDRSKITRDMLDIKQIENLNNRMEDNDRQYLHNVNTVYKEIVDSAKTYEQRRNDIIKEYADKRRSLYAGGYYDNVAEVDRQEREALDNLAQEQARKNRAYSAWVNTLNAYTLRELNTLLEGVKQELEAAEESGASAETVALLQAKVMVLVDQIETLKAEMEAAAEVADNIAPRQREIAAWEALRGTVGEIANLFSDIVGGMDTVSDEAREFMNLISEGASNMLDSFIEAKRVAAETGKSTADAMQDIMNSADWITMAVKIVLAWAKMIASIFKTIKQDRIDETLKQYTDAIADLTDRLDISVDRLRSAAAAATGYATGAFAGINRGMELYHALAIGMRDDTSAVTAYLERDASKLSAAFRDMVRGLTLSYSQLQSYGMDYYADAIRQAEMYELEIANLTALITKYRQLAADSNNAGKAEEYNQKADDAEKKLEQAMLDRSRVLAEMVDTIFTNTAHGIANQIGDALVSAFESGEDAARAFQLTVSDIMKNVVKNFLIKQYLEKQIAAIYDDVQAMQEHGWTQDEIMNRIMSYFRQLGQSVEGMQQAWQQYQERFGWDETAATATSQGIASASQDSIDDLNGRMTVIQSHTAQLVNSSALCASNTTNILNTLRNIGDDTRNMRGRLSVMADDLHYVRNNI